MKAKGRVAKPAARGERSAMQSQAQENPVENKSVSLDAAASHILTMLSEPVRELLRETASSTLNIPLWQLVAGLIQQSYDIGLFTTPVLDPDWMSNLPARAAMQPEAVCGSCGKKFTPRWPKQSFCIEEDGTSVCGTNYQRDLSRLERERREPKPVYPLGQEPSDRPTSALHKEQGA